jgi:hypothetical protein
MQFVNSTLPWSGVPVRRSDSLPAYLAEHLGESTKYLPAAIALFVDPEVPQASVDTLLVGLTEHLHLEFARRLSRKRRIIELCLLSEGELESFLTQRTKVQPWAIYYSAKGGLGLGQTAASESAGRGVIPCSSMRNHGVAWEATTAGEVQTWLATSRRENSPWDWESDIGHESAHAAFAHVPLFVQSSQQIPDNLLSSAESAEDLTPLHIAQIIYLWSEIAVVAIRGEARPTPTGLPVFSPAELLALLHWSAVVTGDESFTTAATICASLKGIVDVNHGDEIFLIAAPILRAVPRVTMFVNNCHPPTLTMLQDAVRSVAAQ